MGGIEMKGDIFTIRQSGGIGGAWSELEAPSRTVERVVVLPTTNVEIRCASMLRDDATSFGSLKGAVQREFDLLDYLKRLGRVMRRLPEDLQSNSELLAGAAHEAKLPLTRTSLSGDALVRLFVQASPTGTLDQSTIAFRTSVTHGVVKGGRSGRVLLLTVGAALALCLATSLPRIWGSSDAEQGAMSLFS